MKSAFSSSSRGLLVMSAACVLAAAKPAASYLAELSTFDLAASSITVGNSTNGTAKLTSTTKMGYATVNFTSSNTSVATVPASRPVSLSLTAVAPVSAVAPGCATINASFNGKTRGDLLIVQPAPRKTTFGLGIARETIPWPVDTDATLSMPLSGTPATWTLTSSNPSVASVPATVTQSGDVTHFKISARADGCAIITAKVGLQSVSRVVQSVYVGG
ncbi:MAG TPA: hypothetical protein VF042_05640 [Gemmatimonadaceae bacterium]